MEHAFEILGLDASATAAQVREAYREQVKLCHPDQFSTDPERQAAQEKLVTLNLAYEQASQIASANAMDHNLPVEEAMRLAAKMLSQKQPALALRQLIRTQNHTAQWYAMQGRILMDMKQYVSAHQAFSNAVLMEPGVHAYRNGVMEAALAARKQQETVGDKLGKLFHFGKKKK